MKKKMEVDKKNKGSCKGVEEKICLMITLNMSQ